MFMHTFKHRPSNNEFMQKLSICQIIVHKALPYYIANKWVFTFMIIITNMHQKECNLLNLEFTCNISYMALN